jgi:glucose-1-phosphate cytidylyltransferase
MTYGDGVGSVDVASSIAFHKMHGRLATLTAVQSPGRFGAFVLDAEKDEVDAFREKPKGDGAWINGGFFVLSPKVLDLIDGDATTWEREPLEILASTNQLNAFKHDGFWQPMDTLRDKQHLEELWGAGRAPWKVWD